ncbi:PP2C family protein-serine/threonine phosphatase [Bifidobacterium gallicum]|uniref:Putative phosphoprotein phosphatase n=1 Tax=Bifidobacterium gallicum DSM 20093 = LMG 11596 TaxID=561180 RepID=D1NTA8_9BIFI|nr:hypothetical protein [Bifidobacterium gallicum]EFA22962.1 hypothetical protein BIFGAL_03065 [Bifidobacterium gallicum DSM 20093 = LMG 11596]KFI57715.1 putative phosphoprotein phosphatase [Bifidobacterium gallicum DSM 20093 = LMG 11596]
MNAQAIAAYGCSDIGKRRATNQDSFVVSSGVYLVCDGMGGAQGGERASALTAQQMATLAQMPCREPADIREALRQAQVQTLALGRELGGVAGTTVTGIVCEYAPQPNAAGARGESDEAGEYLDENLDGPTLTDLSPISANGQQAAAGQPDHAAQPDATALLGQGEHPAQGAQSTDTDHSAHANHPTHARHARHATHRKAALDADATLTSEEARQFAVHDALSAGESGPGTVFVVNVGDSRTYHLDRFPDGSFNPATLRQLTKDHSRRQEALDSGMSVQEVNRTIARNVITQCVGAPAGIRPDVTPVPATGRFIICSDGLHALVDDETIAHIASSHQDVAQTARLLIDAALDGGGDDNVSVVVVDMPTTQPTVGAWTVPNDDDDMDSTMQS